MTWRKLRIDRRLTGIVNDNSTGVNVDVTVVFDDAVTPLLARYRCSDATADELVTKLNSVDYP